MWGAVRWCRQCATDHGGLLGRRNLALLDIKASGEGFTPERLQALADGGIMDANALFLPDGKLTMEETLRREQSGVERLTPPPDAPTCNREY